MRYKALDGWRGVCALVVALFHFPILSVLTMNMFMAHGYLFVDFFFVLSGFIIASNYKGRIETPGDARSFMLKRFARLWPLHAATLLAMVAWESFKAIVAPNMGEVVPFHNGREPIAILSNLFLLQGLGVHDRLTWNGPSWSISTEFASYLVFALVCLLAPKRIRLVAVLMVVGGLGVILKFKGHMDTTYDYGFFRAVAGFFLGVLVQSAPPPKFSKAMATAFELISIALIVGLMALFHQGPIQILAPLLFALIVWLFSSEEGFISGLLKTGPIQKLGLWSYSIYLVHFPIVVAVGILRKLAEKGLHLDLTRPFAAPGGVQNLIFVHSQLVTELIVLGYLALVIAVASQTYRFIEAPGRDLLNGWFSRWTQTRPKPVAGAAATAE